ncbi:LysE family translocator [Rhizobium sp. BK376]|uniref:LysE family translocator n=1 Tax=Rhizobium sp. BK376 TaxID=2512149 RepID=UPI00104CC11D|nr:LysE family translocator [Rhizobium sp. BK376]TCR83897.1 threonine/homoserine/homoserine lactone efflux protein [Rhizobium sp. BK376]
MSLEYLLTSMIVILLPGTGVLYTLAYGLSKGWRASLLAAFGCTLGIVPHIVASVAGLAALLYASAMAFQVIKYLGVAYLFYMAFNVLRSGGSLQIDESNRSVTPARIVINGILLNILNPKLSIFFLAFLPQFVPVTSTAPTSEMLELGLIFMALTFITFLGYGAFASATRHYVIARPRVLLWFRRGFAGAFGLLGLRLALAHQ